MRVGKVLVVLSSIIIIAEVLQLIHEFKKEEKNKKTITSSICTIIALILVILSQVFNTLN